MCSVWVIFLVELLNCVFGLNIKIQRAWMPDLYKSHAGMWLLILTSWLSFKLQISVCTCRGGEKKSKVSLYAKDAECAREGRLSVCLFVCSCKWSASLVSLLLWTSVPLSTLWQSPAALLDGALIAVAGSCWDVVTLPPAWQGHADLEEIYGVTQHNRYLLSLVCASSPLHFQTSAPKAAL